MMDYKGKIITVKGPMEPDSSLFFQCHEHLLMGKGKPGEKYPELYYDELDKSIQEAQDYVNAGGGGLVEAQPVGCCRMTEELVKISEVTGLRIVASTGFHKMAFYPEGHWIFKEDEKQLTRIFLHELCQGMYVDGAYDKPEQWISSRAGQIKTAMETSELNPQYHKVFAAAAATARETGAPVMLHVENGQHPLRYFEFLEQQGIEPEQMIFCHLDRACKDIQIHKELAKAGVYIEYDTIAREKYHSDERELEIFREMIASGFEDRLLFSLDTTRKRLKAYGGETGLTYILCVFLNKMKNAGISREIIDKICRVNPSRALAWK